MVVLYPLPYILRVASSSQSLRARSCDAQGCALRGVVAQHNKRRKDRNRGTHRDDMCIPALPACASPSSSTSTMESVTQVSITPLPYFFLLYHSSLLSLACFLLSSFSSFHLLIILIIFNSFSLSLSFSLFSLFSLFSSFSSSSPSSDSLYYEHYYRSRLLIFLIILFHTFHSSSSSFFLFILIHTSFHFSHSSKALRKDFLKVCFYAKIPPLLFLQ